MNEFDFSAPVRVHYGEGLLGRLGELCAPYNKALVVVGQGSAQKSGLLDRVRDALGSERVEVFSGVEQNPSIETCEKGASAAIDYGADLVVGLGGGSAMDAAKVIASLAGNRCRFRDLYGKAEWPVPPLRLVAIPTTCGTGSEANRYSIITDRQAVDKINFSSKWTYPELAVLDPSVLYKAPQDLIVSTAFDAFSHALEGYTSTITKPFSDPLALEAMRLIVSNLPGAYGGDREAMSQLLYASSVAGIVIDHGGTSMLHALGYYWTLRHDVPHGRANALLLPMLMGHLESTWPERIAEVYNLFPESQRGVDGMKSFIAEVGIDPADLFAGIGEDEFPAIAEYVANSRGAARTMGGMSEALILDLLKKHRE